MERNSNVNYSEISSEQNNQTVSNELNNYISKDEVFYRVRSASALSTNGKNSNATLSNGTSDGNTLSNKSEENLHRNLNNDKELARCNSENYPSCSNQIKRSQSSSKLSLSANSLVSNSNSERRNNCAIIKDDANGVEFTTCSCSSSSTIKNSDDGTFINNRTCSNDTIPREADIHTASTTIDIGILSQPVSNNGSTNSMPSTSNLQQNSAHINIHCVSAFPRINDLTLTIPVPSSVPQPSVLSPYDIPSAGYQRRQIDPFQVIITPQQAQAFSSYSTSALTLNDFKPTITSSIFSFVMTLVFVLVLWLVVFMVFGSRGHAIAGVFIGLFFVGILLNTCFLKFYFRLRLFLGMNPNLVTADRDSSATHDTQRNLQTEEQEPNIKAMEEPPSYAIVEESPPPYDLLQYCTENQLTTKEEFVNNSAEYPTFSGCENERHYICPFCENEGTHFGLCDKCKVKLSH